MRNGKRSRRKRRIDFEWPKMVKAKWETCCKKNKRGGRLSVTASESLSLSLCVLRGNLHSNQPTRRKEQRQKQTRQNKTNTVWDSTAIAVVYS